MDPPRPAPRANIAYLTDLDGVTAAQLRGFFDGWPDPPTPETHLRILRGSATVVLAVDTETGCVVGFVTALSDGVLSAYPPLCRALGLRPATGASVRRYALQSGAPAG